MVSGVPATCNLISRIPSQSQHYSWSPVEHCTNSNGCDGEGRSGQSGVSQSRSATDDETKPRFYVAWSLLGDWPTDWRPSGVTSLLNPLLPTSFSTTTIGSLYRNNRRLRSDGPSQTTLCRDVAIHSRTSSAVVGTFPGSVRCRCVKHWLSILHKADCPTSVINKNRRPRYLVEVCVIKFNLELSCADSYAQLSMRYKFTVILSDNRFFSLLGLLFGL